LTRRCAGIKRDGGRCTAIVTAGDDYCYQHDPERAEQRRRAASRAGRARPSREISGLKREVRDLISGVKRGEQDRGAAAVMLQGYRVLKDYLELERRIKTTDELAAEIAAIREELDRRDRARA
jgi:hypothetical protein